MPPPPEPDEEVAVVRALRMRGQGLAPGSDSWESPGDVARGMLAMQAQDPRGVLWSLAVRASSRPDEVTTAEAFASGSVVRNRPSRGTLQVTSAEDMGWLSELLSQRSRAAAVKRRSRLGLTDEVVERATGVITSELSGGEVRARGELVEACRAAGIELDGSQAGHILRHLTETMRIVLAGAPGNEDEFCAGERLVDDGRKLSGEDALRELALRFFSSRGPATAQCFSWWTNLTMGDTRRALDAAGDELQELDLLGERFVLGADADIPDHSTALELLSEPLLLAPFDEYLLAYRSRDAAIDPEHLERVVPGRNGMFKPIVVARGEVVGIWSRKATSRSVRVEVQPFSPLDPDDVAGLERRADEYGTFLGLEADLVVADDPR